MFSSEELHFLGHVVGEQGVVTDPEKTRAISERTQITSETELRSFLGLASYYDDDSSVRGPGRT